MTKKKTPIQELVDDLTRRGIFLNPSKTTLLIKNSIDSLAEKEKLFASECFEAGRSYHGGEIRYSLTKKPHDQPSFYEFYSQYN